MKLTIYQTNDIHSNFDRLAQIAGYLKKNRKPDDLYFDCGDLCDLKDVMVQGTKGAGAIRLLQEAGADAMAVGNNELDLTKTNLLECAREPLPLLTCNVTDNSGAELSGMRKSILLERMGVRFLVIGCSPYYSYDGTFLPGKYNVFFEMGDLKTTEPVAEIRKELERSRGSYDFCILLSHSGVAVERMIAEEIPEIDLILGGHSHSVICEDNYIQAGKWGECLGKTVLEIEEGKVCKIETSLIKIEECSSDESKVSERRDDFIADKIFMQRYKEEQEIADRFLDKTLYEIPELAWDARQENLLTNFIAEALYAEYPCDLAFTNAGIVEHGIGGEISKKKLLELSPSKLNPTRFPIRGSALKEAIVHSFQPEFVSQSAPGAGVRWSVLGTLGFSHNVTISREPLKILIDGKALEDDREYLCVAHDALQRGTGYEELAVADEKAEYFDGFIRDLLERTLQRTELWERAKLKRMIQNENK